MVTTARRGEGLELEAVTELVSGSPWAYAIILAVAALDALVPVVPSETTVISAGVLAGAGELQVAFVIGAAAAGAFAGDTSAYWLGRALAPRIRRRTARSAKAAARQRRAEEALGRHGVTLVFGGRFVPGGRTAATVTSGVLGMAWLRFGLVAAAAALAWAAYAGSIGYLGGRAFEDDLVLGLAVGFGLAAAVFLAVEAGRRIRRARRAPGPPEHLQVPERPAEERRAA